MGSEQDKYLVLFDGDVDDKTSCIGESPLSYPTYSGGVQGITPREVHSTPNVLTSWQQQILVGTVLGDGCLATHGRYHRLFVKHAVAQEALASLKREAFGDVVTMPLRRFDQRLGGKRYPCVHFVTRTGPVFSEWHGVF